MLSNFSATAIKHSATNSSVRPFVRKLFGRTCEMAEVIELKKKPYMVWLRQRMRRPLGISKPVCPRADARACSPVRRVAVLEGGFRGWERQRLPAGSLSLREAASSQRVFAAGMSQLSSGEAGVFSVFCWPELVNLLRKGHVCLLAD